MSREVIVENGVTREHYPTLNAALEVRPLPLNADFYEHQLNAQPEAGLLMWFGSNRFTTTRDALAALETGKVPEILERVRKYHATLALANTAAVARMRAPVARRVRARGDMGNELDMGLARIGRHDIAWGKTVRMPVVTGARRAVLYVGLQAGYTLDARDLDWRAATAWVIYEKLIQSGYSVEVVVGNVNNDVFEDSVRHGDSPDYEATFIAKPFTMPLSAEKLALMCSAMFYRTVVFQARIATSQTRRVRSNLGRSLQGLIPAHVRGLEASGALVVQVSSATQNQSLAQQAVNTAMAALAERAVKVA